MSTRSYICIQEDANKYKGIYCHHDGYLSYNGMLLQNFYSKRETVEELINLGDISSLNEKINPDPRFEHSFKFQQFDVVVAYGRDRGETENISAKYIDLN